METNLEESKEQKLAKDALIKALVAIIVLFGMAATFNEMMECFDDDHGIAALGKTCSAIGAIGCPCNDGETCNESLLCEKTCDQCDMMSTQARLPRNMCFGGAIVFSLVWTYGAYCYTQENYAMATKVGECIGADKNGQTAADASG